MRAACDALEPDMKSRIEGLAAHHSLARSQARSARSRSGRLQATATRATRAPMRPLVKRHPVTGRRSLFIGRHAYGVSGLSERESERLLDELLDFACQSTARVAPSLASGRRRGLGQSLRASPRAALGSVGAPRHAPHPDRRRPGDRVRSRGWYGPVTRFHPTKPGECDGRSRDHPMRCSTCGCRRARGRCSRQGQGLHQERGRADHARVLPARREAAPSAGRGRPDSSSCSTA